MASNVGLRSSELARLAGVSTDTLRHYERKGVLERPRRSPNGYRAYSPQALDRVRLVRRALAVGFTLDELARILRERDTGVAPCRQVRELAATKLAFVEERLKEFAAVRDELRATLKDWDAQLKQTKEGQRAGLLEALATKKAKSERGTKTLAPTWARRKRREKDDKSD